MTARGILSLAVNAAIFIAVFATWLRMALKVDESGMLTAAGLRSLKYFTVLSNLLQGGASLAYVIALPSGGVPPGLRVVRYAATASVLLTFATTALYLGPIYGMGKMFRGVNLWFHLIVPLAAALDFALLDPTGPVPFAASFAALVPMALYAAGYVANLLVHAPGEGRDAADWYAFLRRGWAGGGVIAAVLVLGTWGMALLLRLVRGG